MFTWCILAAVNQCFIYLRWPYLNTSCYLVNGCLLCTLYSPHHDIAVCVCVFFFSSLFSIIVVHWQGGSRWHGTVTIGLLSNLTLSVLLDWLSVGECHCGQTDISSCLHAFTHSCDPDGVACNHRQSTAVLSLGLDSYGFWIRATCLVTDWSIILVAFVWHYSYHVLSIILHVTLLLRYWHADFTV